MLNLNDTNTWVGLIAAPLGFGAILDVLIKSDSKAQLFTRLESLSQMVSRPWVIYCVGFIASIGTGLACVHVAGLTQKIEGMGGWWTAIQSAAPIALFLLCKAMVLDPALFWGSGRLYAALKGKDVHGRLIPRAARWFTMGLCLLGACLLTQAILTGAEVAQEASLRKMLPAVERVQVPESSRPPAKPPLVPGVAAAESAPASTAQDVAAKPFAIRDVLSSFSLVAADFYAHAFLVLNGAACFILLITFVRVARWCASHIDMPMVPKCLFSALALTASAIITLLLVGYRVVESL